MLDEFFIYGIAQRSEFAHIKVAFMNNNYYHIFFLNKKKTAPAYRFYLKLHPASQKCPVSNSAIVYPDTYLLVAASAAALNGKINSPLSILVYFSLCLSNVAVSHDSSGCGKASCGIEAISSLLATFTSATVAGFIVYG